MREADRFPPSTTKATKALGYTSASPPISYCRNNEAQTQINSFHVLSY